MAFSEILARLAVSLSLDPTSFTTGSRKAQAEASALEKRMSQLGGALAKTFAGVFAADKLSELVISAVDFASSLSESAEKVGLTVEAYQELGFAAQQSGVQQEQLDIALTKLNKSLGAAEQGSKPMIAALEAIGLSISDLKGLRPEEQFALISDHLNKLPDLQQKVAVGSTLMGKGFSQLIPLVNGGSESLKGYAAQQKAQGEISDENAQQLDALADSWDALKRSVLIATANIVAALIPVGKTIANFVGGTIENLATAIDQINRFGAAFNTIVNIYRTITGAPTRAPTQAIDTKSMHSAAAAMMNFKVAAVSAKKGANEFAGEMNDAGDAAEKAGKKGHKAISGISDATRQAQKDAKTYADLLDRLFPDRKAISDYHADLASLDAAYKKGTLSAEDYQQAVYKLGVQFGETTKPAALPEITGLADVKSIFPEVGSLEDAMNHLAGKTKDATTRIAKSFKDMANDTLSSLQNLTNSIKGGGFLSILQSALNFALQLGSIGAFGKTIATRLNTTVPGYAGGTNFHPGGLALVGERGPELVSMPRGSKVYPSGTGPSGGNTYVVNGVITTDEFWKIIGAGNQQAAKAGAAGGMQMTRYAQTRSL